jgi:hypothetical protein
MLRLAIRTTSHALIGILACVSVGTSPASATCSDASALVDLAVLGATITGPDSDGRLHITLSLDRVLMSDEAAIPAATIVIRRPDGTNVASTLAEHLSIAASCTAEGWGGCAGGGGCGSVCSILRCIGEFCWFSTGSCYCKLTPDGQYHGCGCADPTIVSVAFSHTGLPSGTVLTAIADPDNSISEFDECNNTATVTVP